MLQSIQLRALRQRVKYKVEVICAALHRWEFNLFTTIPYIRYSAMIAIWQKWSFKNKVYPNLVFFSFDQYVDAKLHSACWQVMSKKTRKLVLQCAALRRVVFGSCRLKRHSLKCFKTSDRFFSSSFVRDIIPVFDIREVETLLGIF